MEKTMTPQQAIELLSTAKNVNDWNAKREQIKKQVSESDWITTYCPKIDFGLIIQVLGRDR